MGYGPGTGMEGLEGGEVGAGGRLGDRLGASLLVLVSGSLRGLGCGRDLDIPPCDTEICVIGN